MPELILHHYPSSPFSEKIRLILGYKKVRWQSVIIPIIMPKNDVVALTGGYRRTPVLQIGSDIFCDTALIADVLEELHPSPSLYPREANAGGRLLAQWADTTLFWTAIPYVMQPAGFKSLFGTIAPEHIQAFIADRKTFRGSAPRMSPIEATGSLALYLERLESMLADGRPYLLGPLPSIADFSAYHPVWFVRRGGPLSAILDGHRLLSRWSDNMNAIGHGQTSELSSTDAIAIAKTGTHPTRATIRYVDTPGMPLGSRVKIAPSDYGIDFAEGEFVISAANEIAIKRVDPRAGEVVVHFPRIGFQVTPA